MQKYADFIISDLKKKKIKILLYISVTFLLNLDFFTCTLLFSLFSQMTLPAISDGLKSEYDNRMQNDASLQKVFVRFLEISIFFFW